jgi:hypothetical protein
MGKLSSSIARFSKQKLIPAIVVNVLGPYVSVKLSGYGSVMTKLNYTGPVPVVGQKVQVNYQTGTPYVQTQTIPETILPASIKPKLGGAAQVATTSPEVPPAPVPNGYYPSFPWIISNPAAGNIPGLLMTKARVAVKVVAYAWGGAVVFNIEKRTNPNTTGTSLLSSDLTAPNNSIAGAILTSTAFSTTALDYNYYILPIIISTTGTPTYIMIQLVIEQ